MRIRSTKPEFWRSKTIAQLDWDTRLVLKALESYVDDNGVGRDSIVIFCADAFPYDLVNSPEICAKVSRSLARLSEANIIVRYTVAGEELVYVRAWKKWQYIDKPKAGRFPRPDGTMNYREAVDESVGAGQGISDPVNPEDVPQPPENFAKSSRKVPEECPQIQSGEQGNRGTGEIFGCVRTEPDTEPNPTAALSATPGADLVREIIPTNHPASTKTSLRIQASELLRTGTETDDVRAALRLWLDKPNLGAGRTVLAGLVSEVIKDRAAHVRPAASDAAFAAAQALKSTPANRLELA